MERSAAFSYQCNQCGRCCHGQVITLSPYDVIRLAVAAHISTSEAIAKYTIGRGATLKFQQDGRCAALAASTCTVHPGRPLACRLYPLGLEHGEHGSERYVRVAPAAGSKGIYGEHGTIQDFLGSQGAEIYLAMNRRYAELLKIFRARIAEIVDFDTVEPREFWRIAVREALAETGFDPNPLIDALFDANRFGRCGSSDSELVENHLAALQRLILEEQDAAVLASAAIRLAVSLGYSPRNIITWP
jgi:Fe-S-cluster containining protein